MANFPTHIAVGTLVSGTLATLTLAADAVSPENVLAVAVAGVVGSILPDIDLKESRPSQAMFNGLGLFIAFALLFCFVDRLSIAEMWVLWIGTYIGIRYFAYFIFHRMSYHRGIYHSVLAGVFFWFVTAIIYRYVLQRHEGVAWLAGFFTFLGYMVHLILDEIYSVDVMGTRIKKSFGTALKLVDQKHWGHTGAMATATVIAFLLAPPADVFVDGITSRPLWATLHEKLLPKDKWFGVFDPASVKRLHARINGRDYVDISTGSIEPGDGDGAAGADNRTGTLGESLSPGSKQAPNLADKASPAVEQPGRE